MGSIKALRQLFQNLALFGQIPYIVKLGEGTKIYEGIYVPTRATKGNLIHYMAVNDKGAPMLTCLTLSHKNVFPVLKPMKEMSVEIASQLSFVNPLLINRVGSENFIKQIVKQASDFGKMSHSDIVLLCENKLDIFGFIKKGIAFNYYQKLTEINGAGIYI